MYKIGEYCNKKESAYATWRDHLAEPHSIITLKEGRIKSACCVPFAENVLASLIKCKDMLTLQMRKHLTIARKLSISERHTAWRRLNGRKESGVTFCRDICVYFRAVSAGKLCNGSWCNDGCELYVTDTIAIKLFNAGIDSIADLRKIQRDKTSSFCNCTMRDILKELLETKDVEYVIYDFIHPLHTSYTEIP